MSANTSGSGNAAFGYYSLNANTTGVDNSAYGFSAMTVNTTGDHNAAFGSFALYNNTTGRLNSAFGDSALDLTTTGASNSSVGEASLLTNTTGSFNAALGDFALANNSTGSNNTALGSNAGYNITGSNNIDISNQGTSADNGIIRIGSSGSQTSTYIAGISGVSVSGAAVIVNSNGQLGVVSSSRRYKQDIEPMGDASERLFQLRPVKFRYIKPDENGNKPIQYGLIAEEVAKVFPELAVYNKDGQPETVAYHLLATLLLNEVQKEHQKVEESSIELAAERKELDAMKLQVAQVQELKDKLAAFEQTARELRAQQTALTRLLGGTLPKSVKRVRQITQQ